MTTSERLLSAALRDRRLDGLKFRRQARIGHFVVDFYCAERRLVVEVDGSVHVTQQSHDRERQALVEEMGFRVLRLGAETVEASLERALAVIRNACFDVSLALEEGEEWPKARVSE